MVNVIKKIWEKVESWLFPSVAKCLRCGKELRDGELCEDCNREFYLNDGNRCEKCSRPTVSLDDNLCEQCKEQDNEFDFVRAPVVYKGTALELIRKFKYRERRDIGPFFVGFMTKELSAFEDADVIIPVPMWDGKYRERTYSSAHELCTLIARESGKEMRVDLVEKVKDTGTQTALSREKRQENVKKSFQVIDKKGIKGKKILIVDDVYTTGATANELAKVLKKAKADKVYVLTATIAPGKR